MSEQVLPYGSWPSPLTAVRAAEGAVRFAQGGLTWGADGRIVAWWGELRPAEQGRTAVLRCVVDESSEPEAVGPPDLSARSSVNEYGGGSWWVSGDVVHWVDAGDQRIRRVDTPDPLTPAPPEARAWRYASGSSTPDGRWIVCERELHLGAAGEPLDEVVNDLVAVAGSGGEVVRLVGPDDAGGGDFAADPVLSPDGSCLAWLRWDHPDMPWDAAELWAGRLVAGDGPMVVDARRVAGGHDAPVADGGDRPDRADRAGRADRAVSVCLPEWSPDGRLWWCDDSDDWWHLKSAPTPGLPDAGSGDGVGAAMVESGVWEQEEVGEPRWIAGGGRFGFTDDGRIVFAASANGLDSLWVWDPATGHRSQLIEPGFTYVEQVDVVGSTVLVVGGASHRPTSVWAIDLDSGWTRDLRASEGAADPEFPPGDVSVPIGMSFPTDGDDDVHVLFFPPHRFGLVGPEDDLPPLVVRIHGGPTGAARAELSTSVQFWTTRGFAVAEVNYRGSTGYGRRYRDLLHQRWGEFDVNDCIAAARGLATAGLVDGDRCVIRGGSAGGLTTLNALVDPPGGRSSFAAGCSLYGVTDLMALATDTHKFESRYLDGLVGPLPETAARYRDRSPLYHADRLARPVLLLQGEDDRVVPPSQAEVLLTALSANAVPHAFVLFPGEGHGFRRSETLVAALETELAFYGQVLGFTPADDLPAVELH